MPRPPYKTRKAAASAQAEAKSADTLLCFDAETMRAFIARLFAAAGWPKADCAIIAEHLVTADRSGHPSHGIGMVPTYVEAIIAKQVLPTTIPRTRVESGPFLVIDAELSLGQPAAARATERAIAIAQRCGIAVANLVHAFHIGRIGHYGEMVAGAGLVGLFWVNVHGRPAVVAPHWGREARFGTNPHCVAIPRPGAQPFLLDFATSEIAMGKARVAYAQGKKVKLGALIDHRGRPTTDPAVMFEEPFGALGPFGAHKGYGLAMVCELLSSVLGGGHMINEDHEQGIVQNNMLTIVIDPARLGTGDAELRRLVEGYIGWSRSAAPAEGQSEVLIPGDPEFRSRAAFGDSMVIEPVTWSQIEAAAGQLKLPKSALPRPVG
jgi:uncharacterized oxidoreductase